MSANTEDAGKDKPPSAISELELDVYKVALEYVVATSKDTWARFSAMLVAHAILVAVSANLMFGDTHRPVPGAAPAAILGAGLIVCFAWWAAIERGLKYQDRYVDFAKRFEQKLPADLRLLEDGAATTMGFASGLRGRHTMRIVVIVFSCLYLGGLGLLVAPCLVHQ